MTASTKPQEWTKAMMRLASYWESTANDLDAASEKERDPEAAKTQRIMKAVYHQLASELRHAVSTVLVMPKAEVEGVRVTDEQIDEIRSVLDEGARSHRLYAMDYTEGSDPWRECIEMAERQESALAKLDAGGGRGQ